MKMNRNALVLIAVAGVAYAAGRWGPSAPAEARAQATPETVPEEDGYRQATGPGPHHRHLDQLVGEWSGEFTLWMDADATPIVSHGTVSRRWILGGRFLEESVKAQGEQATYNSVGYIGYNNLDGQYQTVWMDNMSTAIHTETGTYHDDTKILHTRGSDRDPVTGRVTTTWTKLDLSDPARHTATGWAVGPDGRVFTAFEGVLHRSN